MQALRDEMDLRDRTREAENIAGAVEEKVYEDNAETLSKRQTEIAQNVFSAGQDIMELPNASEFGNELKLLQAVTRVMEEASDILVSPDTGPSAIAAETEAIELLLQARRNKPGGGGGGGGDSPGGGGSAERALSAALAALGPGSDALTKAAARNVGQATGRAGRELPEEFRSGLDAYFHALESDRSANP